MADKDVFEIHLVTMPFSALHLPSIALAQLKGVVEEQFGARVRVHTHYFNHEFADYFGRERYDFIATGHEAQLSGLGDWIFRRAAFPDVRDNVDEFFGRYGMHFGGSIGGAPVKDLLARRERIDDFLDELIVRHGLDRADLVGITTMFAQNTASFALARRIKLCSPGIGVALGGANCEGAMGVEMAHHVPAVDWVFSGHALCSFPALIERLMAGDRAACDRIDGVFTRRNSRSIKDTPVDWSTLWWEKHDVQTQLDGIKAQAPVRHIDLSPFPDYEDFLASYAAHGAERVREPEVLFETSRGCWWGAKMHCTFCGLNGESLAYHGMAPYVALDHFRKLFERYGGRVKRFSSVDNIVSPVHIEQVFPYIEPPPDASLFYEVRANLSAEKLEVLARARVLEMQPGIESFDSGTLKLMRKGTTSFQGLQFLTISGRLGISPSWNLLVGFPGETAQTYKRYDEVLPMLVHLPPPMGVFPVRFDRFSPYFFDATTYGLDLRPLDYYEMIYPFPEVVRHSIAYYFRDLHVDAKYVTELSPWLKPLQRHIENWRRRYYGSDAAQPARITARRAGDRLVVSDTRSGRLVRHFLDSAETAALEILCRKPRAIPQAERDMPPMRSLIAKGLVYLEDERGLSLVDLDSVKVRALQRPSATVPEEPRVQAGAGLPAFRALAHAEGAD